MSIADALPVRRFDVEGLADVVVIAGPNGVGKTRLMERTVALLRGDQSHGESRLRLQATSRDERDSWGKAELDLSVERDLGLYRTTLQTNRQRRNWTSSVLQFESDRTIQKLQPFQFQWDLPDPSVEAVGWDFGFQGWKNRWQDTVHALFKIIEHQKQSIASRAVQLKRSGHESMNLNFGDPIEPFKEVFSQLLGPKELADPSARTQRLEYLLDGQTLSFDTLSSGEREVVNIAFDYLLRRPHDCVVFFDEPELHLHPELSHRLIQTLQAIGERNQLILTTHSPDIIAGALDKSVVFVSPPAQGADGSPRNQAMPVSEDDETNQALRLLGHSVGIISLGQRIVLIEGRDSSLDKETYGTIVRRRHPDLVLVPSGGKHAIESFDLVHRAVLSKSLWGVEFLMVCDRDAAPAGLGSQRMRVLPRYHLENYFLDENTWAPIFEDLEADDSWLRDPAEVRACLREIAAGFVSHATALAVSAHVRRSVGNIDTMPSPSHGLTPEEVANRLVDAATTERDRVGALLDPDAIRAYAEQYSSALTDSLSADTDTWKIQIPGKPVLGAFASKAGLHAARLRRMYLRACADDVHGPFADIHALFDELSTIAPAA